MNFAFRAQETKLCEQIAATMRSLDQEHDLETTDQQTAAVNLRTALSSLAACGYLHLGLAPHPTGIEGPILVLKAMEAVAMVAPSVCLSVEMSTRMFGRILNTWGNGEHKERWLTPVINGQRLGAVALSEGAMNVDNDPLQTEARLEGDTAVISGRKTYVVNAGIADWIAVAGRIEKQPAFFLIDKASPGLKISRRLKTLGYEAVVINDLVLDKCRIPGQRIIGPFGNQPILEIVRLWENQILLGLSLGLTQAALQAAQTYANEHHTGGKPIIAYQEVAFKLAEMLTLLQTAQLLAYRAVWTADKDPREAQSLTWCAKVFCTEAAEKVASSALQILAGAGFTSGNVAERAYRCAKYGQIAGTSTEIARVKIGDAALGQRL